MSKKEVNCKRSRFGFKSESQLPKTNRLFVQNGKNVLINKQRATDYFPHSVTLLGRYMPVTTRINNNISTTPINSNI